MKEYFFYSSLLLFSLMMPFIGSTQSQIELINPLPRIGDEIRATIAINNASQKNGEITIHLHNKGYNQNRECWLGPMSFRIGDINLKTDSILLRYDDALPAVDNGFWIRYIDSKEFLTLIIEEHNPINWKSDTKTQGESEFSLNTSKDHFEFDVSLLENSGFSVLKSNTEKKIKFFELTKQQKVFYSYKIKLVKFVKNGKFKGPLILDQRFFKNRKLDKPDYIIIQ